MIDPLAARCAVVAVVGLIAGYVILRLIEWGWDSKPARPLKEKSAQQKAQEKKRARRAAQHMIDAPESHWKRPGSPSQSQPSVMPIFGEGQPRHVRIDNTPHVIIPHETVGPAPGHASYQHNLPAVKIKPVDASEPPASPDSKPIIKPNKVNKSNHTMPLKRIP